jgi:SAM-dependent methyltransferase
MPGDVYQPFNEDVERHGGYQYALADRRSTTHVNRRFSDVIQTGVPMEGARVVDVGCGDGTYTAELVRETRAASVLGIDPAGAAIALARERHGTQGGRLAFRNCLAADLVRDGERFDVAVYRGVIHHVGDPAAEIALGLRLAPTVFFLEPNGWNPVLKALERVSPYHRSHGERSFVALRYRRWIEAAGGETARVRFFGLVPIFSPDWLVSLGAALEPLVEALPGLRTLVCGQVGILARRAGGAP